MKGSNEDQDLYNYNLTVGLHSREFSGKVWISHSENGEQTHKNGVVRSGKSYEISLSIFTVDVHRFSCRKRRQI